MKGIKVNESEANASWARVELWRWQYGHLPDAGDTSRPLDIELAAKAMAMACREGKVKPFNAASVIEYLGLPREGSKP